MKLALATEKARTYLSKLFERETGDYMNPTRHWLIGLLFGATLFLAGIFFIGFDFYVQFGVPDKEVSVPTPQSAYQRDAIMRLYDQYNEREKTFNVLRADRGAVQIVPPSPNEVRATSTRTESASDTPLANDLAPEYTSGASESDAGTTSP